MVIKTRRLGLTGFDVSEISLGSVKFGRTAGLKYPNRASIPNDEQLNKLIYQANDLGINLLDTAPAYGESEQRIGDLLRNEIKDWKISTKVGEEFDGKSSHFNFEPAAIKKSIYRSLKRLRRDHLDIALIHSNGEDENILLNFGALETLKTLKQRGLIKAVGISYKTSIGANIAISQGADLLMATLNSSDKSQEKKIREAFDSGVGVLVKKPFASGYQANASSLRFVLEHDEVTSVVIGTTSIDHLKENAIWANYH